MNDHVITAGDKPKFSIKGMPEVFKNSFNGFMDDKVLKLSASLAYYMIFSMGPLILIVITLCSIFYGHDAVQGRVNGQLESFLGHDTALQLQEIIKSAAITGKTKLATIIGVVALLIGATSVFAEMQDSINMIWQLKPKPKKGWLAFIKNRFLSFSLIVSLGFLLLVSLGVAAIVEAFGNRLHRLLPGISLIVIYILNLVITIGVTSFIFAVMFKVLPDAKIKWKDVIVGSVTTTLLFLLGKFAISFYISKSNVGSTYGTAGSLIVVLLWIYYSAAILYFGAEFTKAYAVKFGSQIHPADYAVVVNQVEEEKEGVSVQQNTKDQK